MLKISTTKNTLMNEHEQSVWNGFTLIEILNKAECIWSYKKYGG